MWRVLLAKDLRRTWRNPLPVLINLALPLCVAGLVGLAFGGKSDGGALGRIRFALVDEDKTILSDFLRGSANQREGGKYLEPVLLERDEAMRLINDNKISAVLVIPTNFTRHYFSGRESVSLELIKNPAQSIHPAVMEELLGALVTTLNAVSRNLQSEFPDWQAVIEGKRDYKQIAGLIERAGNKLKQAEQFINPPLVVYEKTAPDLPPDNAASSTTGKGGAKKGQPTSEVFGYLLPGMAGMFLLFLASNAMTDLHREMRQRTLARYHTLHHQLAPFVAAKVVFAVVVLLLCSVILLTGGGWLFGIDWRAPGPLALLTVGYAGFAAGLMAVLVALIPDERKASALNTVVAMGLALAGGCMFPPQALPAFLGQHITPLLPTHWFVETARNLQYSGSEVPWVLALVKLSIVSVALMLLAALLFRRQLRAGVQV
ncbi:MAG: ABC transporter permease [Verrucomicrobia bacterium]|nr:ABC transporter permease [Verrucomicrobiota bacterium]